MEGHGVRMNAELSSIPSPATTSRSSSTIDDPLTKVKRRNSQVAFFSIALACFQYLWQYLHPLEPIALLYDMQQTSSPMTVIGTTDKPTVVDFWAPWYGLSNVSLFLGFCVLPSHMFDTCILCLYRPISLIGRRTFYLQVRKLQATGSNLVPSGTNLLVVD
jgi:hypothetical protein